MKIINLSWQCIGTRILAITYIILALSACPSPENTDKIVSVIPVTGITGVPTATTEGMPLTLSGTVTPSNATNKTIVWSVVSGPAAVSGNTLNTTSAGTVIVRATIANGIAQGTAYTRNFTITVNAAFVAVSDITNVPTTTTVETPLTLTGTVSPSNATNQTIDWSVVSGPATVSENTLNPTGAGTVSLLATIVNGIAQDTNYTQTFTITVNGDGTTFVAVSDITSVPTTATAGTPLILSGTVSPSNATNQTIVWTVSDAGSTGASVSDNVLNTTGAGTVIVTATIANGTAQGTVYTQNFTVTVSSGGAAFVAVSNITNVPTSVTAGTPLTLSGTVSPSNATNKTIVWSVVSGPATVSGNTLNTTGAGTVIVRATIANGIAQGTAYTQNFTVTVSGGSTTFVAVSNITGVPSWATVGTPLTLSSTVTPSNATNKTIVWTVSSAGTTGATISGNTLNTTGTGSISITATIVNGQTASTNYTQNFTITVSAAFVAVSNITSVPTLATVGTPLSLNRTVLPSNATYKTTVWTVNSAGTTGASISGSSTLNTTGIGTVIITATIANGTALGTAYTQNFTITVQQSVSFAVTFTQIADEAPNIIGPTIYRSGTNGPRTATIELDNPGQYSSINWYITGTTVSGVGSSFTLSIANILYNSTGQHFLTVEVVKGGVPYNRTIIFTVAP